MPNFTRRHFFATATGLIPAAVAPPVIFGQDAGRPTFRVKVDLVVLSFTVTDSKGCEASASATIQQAPKPNVTVTASGIVCGGQNTGTAQAQASGGASPYGYSWNNGATTQNLSGLGSGTYIVTATDANG